MSDTVEKDPPIPFPEALWDDLAKVDPLRAAGNCGAVYDQGVFRLEFLGAPFTVDPQTRLVSGPPDRTKADFQKALVLLVYLTWGGQGNPPDPSGRLVGPLEIPGGAMFFRGPHVIAAAPLEMAYGRNKEALLDKALSLGARASSDYLFTWRVLPNIEVAVMFYPEDDEFPAKANYLIESRCHYYMALDAVWGLINAVTNELLPPGAKRAADN
jgi:hypothetical protein